MNRAISVGLSIAVAPALLLAYGRWIGRQDYIDMSEAALFGFCLPIGTALVLIGLFEVLMARRPNQVPPGKANGVRPPKHREPPLLPRTASRQNATPGGSPDAITGPRPLSRWEVGLEYFALASIVAGVIAFSSQMWRSHEEAPAAPPPPPPKPAPSGPELDYRWLPEWQLSELSKAAAGDLGIPDARLDCPAPARPENGRGASVGRGEKLSAEEIAEGIGECEEIEAGRQLAADRRDAEMNEIWRPRLIQAAEAGDPLSQLLIAVCSTLPGLDRRGLNADCSPNPSQRDSARRSLVGNTLPAARAAFGRPPENPAPTDHCPSEDDAGHRCRLKSDLKALRDALVAMETGYLGAAVGWLPCEHAASLGPRDPALNECRHRYRLMREIAWTAPRSYTPGMSVRYRYHPGDSAVGERPPHPAPESAPPPADSPLAREVAEKLAAIEHRIAADLAADPRWKHFVGQRK